MLSPSRLTNSFVECCSPFSPQFFFLSSHFHSFLCTSFRTVNPSEGFTSGLMIGSNRLTVSTNGNVNVGISGDTALFTVNGSIRATKGLASTNSTGYSFETDGDTGLFAAGGAMSAICRLHISLCVLVLSKRDDLLWKHSHTTSGRPGSYQYSSVQQLCCVHYRCSNNFWRVDSGWEC